MEIFLVILVILFLCRVFAEIAERLNQPALVGELLTGIILGLFLKQFGEPFGLSLDFADDEAFRIITDLGIFFLMLLAGLELNPGKMSKSFKESSGIAIGGLLLPLLLGCALGYFTLPESDYKTAQILFIGTAMAITAVPIAVRVLMDFNMLNTKLGHCIVSAAMIDDILSLILLAILTGIIQNGTIPSFASLGILILKVSIFLALCIAAGKFLFPVFTKLLKRGRVEEGDFSGLLLMAFGFALLAEVFALHFIIGAFAAGLVVQRAYVGNHMFNEVEKRIYGITSGFLAPIFFASIGLHVTLGALFETPVFTIGLLILAVIGKMLGSGIPAWLQYKDIRKAGIIGTAMNGRGAVELVILDIALRADLFAHPQPVPPIISNMFSSIVLMAIITTIMTPLVLKWILKTA